MNNRQFRNYSSYTGIVGFLEDRRRLAQDGEVKVVLARFKQCVEEIQGTNTTQWLAKRIANVRPVRRRLDKMRASQMLSLARNARRLFAGEAAMQAALTVPEKTAPSDVILASAKNMVRALKPHRAFLAAEGINVDRLPALASEVRQLEKDLKTAYGSNADRAAPTRALPALFKAAHEDVLLLDSLVAPLATKAELLAWKSARRVSKRLGRPLKRTVERRKKKPES